MHFSWFVALTFFKKRVCFLQFYSDDCSSIFVCTSTTGGDAASEGCSVQCPEGEIAHMRIRPDAVSRYTFS